MKALIIDDQPLIVCGLQAVMGSFYTPVAVSCCSILSSKAWNAQATARYIRVSSRTSNSPSPPIDKDLRQEAMA